MSRQLLAKQLATRLNDSHLSILRVCVELPHKCTDGMFAGEWIKNACEQQGIPFHQAWLTKLVNEGLLMKGDLTRGGGRRYYRIADSELVRRVLASAGVGV